MACLANKVAIITGAASGIGRACALRFLIEERATWPEGTRRDTKCRCAEP